MGNRFRWTSSRIILPPITPPWRTCPVLSPHNNHLLREVGASLELSLRLNIDPFDNDRATSRAGNTDIYRLSPEATRVLKEVVFLPGSSNPGSAVVGADFEALDGEVAVAYLHGEPEGACS